MGFAGPEQYGEFARSLRLALPNTVPDEMPKRKCQIESKI